MIITILKSDVNFAHCLVDIYMMKLSFNDEIQCDTNGGQLLKLVLMMVDGM